MYCGAFVQLFSVFFIALDLPAVYPYFFNVQLSNCYRIDFL